MSSGKLKRGPHNLFVPYATGEVDFRKKHFKDVSDLYKYKSEWKCSMCSCNLENSILKGEFCKHPALNVLVCHKCLEYYGDGLFSPDEEGEDKFCRWCAQGGELYCCSKCVCTFCKKCVLRHFKENKKVMRSLDMENWQCFLCVSKPIWFLRALCWAMYHFKAEFVNSIKDRNDSDTSRSMQHKKSPDRSRRDSKSGKRNRSDSSSSEDESFAKRNKKESERKSTSRGKTSSSKTKRDDSTSDEDFKKKTDRSKTKSNGNEKSEEKKRTKNRSQKSSEEENSEDEDSKKKVVGPKSRHERHKTSSREEKKKNKEEKEESKHHSGSRSRTEKTDEHSERKSRRNKDSKEESERSSDEEKATKTRTGSKSVKETERSSKKTKQEDSEEEKDRDSSEERRKSKKTKLGPKSKVEKSERSSDKKATKRKESEEENEEADGNEIEDGSSDSEGTRKTKLGPKSKVKKPERSSDRKTSKKVENDEEDNSSSDELKAKKTRIGPKSKTDSSSNRRTTRNRDTKEDKNSAEDSSPEEEEKQKKNKIGPKSKVEKSERQTRTSRNEKIEDNSEEEEEEEEPKSSRHKSKKEKSKTKTPSKENENQVKVETKAPSERAVEIFQTTLELCENLAMDIQKKTDKMKKLASENKFRSARNTHKIYTLLNIEMKKNSRLFSQLSELVEDHIGGIDSMFELDEQTLGAIYDQPTLQVTTGDADENDVNMEESKPEENGDTVLENEGMEKDVPMNISAILTSDEEEGDKEEGAKENGDEEADSDNDKVSKNKSESENQSDSEKVSKIRSKRKSGSKEKSDSDTTKNESHSENVSKSKSKGKSDAKNKADSDSKNQSDSDTTKNKSDSDSKSDSKSKSSKKRSSLSTSLPDNTMDVDEEPGDPKLSSTRLPDVRLEDILTDESEIDAAKASVLESEEESVTSRASRSKSRTPSKDKASEDSIHMPSPSSKAKRSSTEKNKTPPMTIDSILTSDDDDKPDVENNADNVDNINLILTSEESDTSTSKVKKEKTPGDQESEYYSMKSESEQEHSGRETSAKEESDKKTKKKSSSKQENSKDSKTKDSESDAEKEDKKKSRRSKGEKDEDKKRRSSLSASVSKLTGLSSLETSSRKDRDRTKSVKEKKSDSPRKSKSSQRKKAKEEKDKSLLEFLNEDDSSSAEELEESTELLSTLIKAKSEEAKKQNEEMIKQALLRAEDESNKEESSNEEAVISEDDKSKVKRKSKKKSKDSSSDSEKKSKGKKKDGWRNDPLLRGKLSDTDTSEGEAKFEAKVKKEKERDMITLSSDEELFSKRKAKKDSSDDSDCLVIKKTPAKKRKARLRDSSDSSDVLVITSSEDTAKSSDSDFKKKAKNKKKRSRIKRMKDSDESGSDAEDVNQSQGTPGKGRKNIRHILSNEELALKTITASKAEEERKKRIEERQARYNKLFKIPENAQEPLTKLVLDFDEKTNTELISVHPDLICKLKPHQVEGVRFMFNACFESVQQIKKNKAGSGCILAHCMGLGKTLQVVTLTHTLMSHKHVTKVERVMVVTPLNTVSNWVDEFHNWLKKINNGNDCETFNLIKSKKDYERSYTLNCWFEEGGVLIIGYEMFRNLINKRGLSKKVKTIVQKTLLDPGPDLVVCDEGHILKNEASAVSKAMCQIRTLRRIILTGTPLQNNLEEYHCMVQFIKPNLLGDKKEFKNRFANPINNGQYIDSTPRDVKIMKRRAHVLYKMLDGIVQRKDYNVLTPFLPPKYEYVISIKMTDLQIKLYSHYLSTNVNMGDQKHRLFADYQTLKLVWTHPYALKSASLTRQKREDAKELSDSEGSLKDFIDDDDDEEEAEDTPSSGSNSPPPTKKKKTRATTRAAKESGEVPSEEEEEQEAAPSFWWTNLVTEEDIQDITNSNKLLAFMFVLKQCEEIGDKLLVFSQSLETLSLLEYFLNKIDECSQDGTLDQNLSQFQASWTLGSDYFRLDGSSSSEDRSYWVKTFNNPTNLRARLFLISTKAGGLGINLVSANRVIIFDVSWNPSHDIQSIFRVFRFGQTKPCYIYRFLAQGTMEEKIYDRQVAKQSMSCRVVDEQQIDRHFTRSDISELYEFKPDEKKDRKTPALPKDRLMAEMIKEMDTKIVAFHEHDSLLENVQDEELNEEERKAAWEEFETEKSRPAQTAGMSYVNNLIMQNNMRQQQAGTFGMAGSSSALSLDANHMMTFLKSSNPDVSEEALAKIVEQNKLRFEDYKKKQESHFQNVINNMHNNMQQARANQMAGGMGQMAGGMGQMAGGMGQMAGGMGQFQMNRMPMGGLNVNMNMPRGLNINMGGGNVPNMGRGPMPNFPRGPTANRPTILKSNARTATAADMMRRVAPLNSAGSGNRTGGRLVPKPSASGTPKEVVELE